MQQSRDSKVLCMVDEACGEEVGAELASPLNKEVGHLSPDES